MTSTTTTTTKYIIDPFAYETATPEDSSQIGAVYDHCFTNDLNLVFDPSLDADFVDPCRYYSKASGGAFFVVRRKKFDYPSSSEQEGTTSTTEVNENDNCIVGTLGVRNFEFESEERWAAFVEGIKANSNPGDLEKSLARRCHVIETPSPSKALSTVSISVEVEGSSSTNLAPTTTHPVKVCELKRMFFLSECRGRHLGKEQVAVALDWAFNHAGYDFCILDTKRRLEAANHVYEKYGGFVECGSYNGNPRADKFMCKAKPQ